MKLREETGIKRREKIRKIRNILYRSQALTYVSHVVRAAQLESRMTPITTVTYTALYIQTQVRPSWRHEGCFHISNMHKAENTYRLTAAPATYVTTKLLLLHKTFCQLRSVIC
jgi:hypothetical protein